MSEIKSLSHNNPVPINRLCRELMLPRASYYRQQIDNAVSKPPSIKPANALDDDSQQVIRDLLHSERFVDCTPYQVYYTLLDKGQYYASISTFYRLLAERGESQPRRDQRSHRDAIKPELIATAHNQVWSWDITKLLCVQRLVYFYLYVIMDIFSRYVVGWLIADRECQLLAEKLIQTATLRQGIQPGQLTLHADNGPSMTSHTVAQLLEHLGILKTHNRPYTCNDNPFSESQFKTLKYCPQFPKKFDSLEHAESFCQTFFPWYNTEHYHSGVLWLTPQTVHSGNADTVLENRLQVKLKCFQEKPARFNNQEPKLKKLQPVYINPPENNCAQNDLQQEVSMA